ncbi:MAG: flagellar hook-length control protein FliK [Planctomycetota bacterium]|jgi:hypothetical protein
MSEQSLNSLFGMPSTTATLPSGTQKTTGNSIQTNHGENGFHARLINSMKDASTDDSQTVLFSSSDVNNTKDINQVIETASLGLSNIIDGNQNITTETITNFTTNNSANGDSAPTKTQTGILSDKVILIQDSKAQESKTLINPGSNLLKVLKEATLPLSDKSNSNLKENSPLNKLTDTINNASTANNRTSSSTQIQANTISDNIHPGNQGPDLLNNMKEPTTPFTDKSNTNQSNAKTNEQNIFGSNKSNPDKIAVEKSPGTNAINALLKTDTYPGQVRNTASSGNHSNTLYNHINDNSRLNIEKDGTNPALQKANAFNRHNSVSNDIFDAKYNTTTNNTINNTLLNPEESANGKIVENLKEQQSDKISPTNTSTKSPSQQGLAKIDSDNNESSIIFNTNSNSAEAKFAKSSDNTTITHNNGVNIGDVTSSANTSSDNSSFNNQGSDVLSEFNINSVNARKISVPETNFTDTLSQINNSSKPLGTLGNNVADNIIQSAKLYMEGGRSEIKMQLNPQELGSLKLEFTVDDDILEAKITVERSAVKDIIEKDIPRLRELISSADIDVGKLDVSLQENEKDRFGFMDKNSHPDSESNSTRDSLDQNEEHFENETEEEPITKNRDSNQINYLV